LVVGVMLCCPYFLYFAVLAESLKFFAVGAPEAPTFLIFSPDPLAIRLRLAWMFAYSPSGILFSNEKKGDPKAPSGITRPVMR